MTQPAQRPSASRGTIIAGAIACLLIGAIAGWQWQARRPIERAAIEQVVHDYLIAHPEVLPEAMDALHRRENAQQVAAIRPALETAYPGAVRGNPQGKRVLVQFTDYACGYCRRSEADVDALVAAQPDLKVVVRELPILTPQSVDAAKMALAAAEQGKFAAFHKAMFAMAGPDATSIAAAARAAGLDMARAQATIARPGTTAEIERNLEFARQLGINGTPSWVAGDALLNGAVGLDALSAALTQAYGRAQ